MKKNKRITIFLSIICIIILLVVGYSYYVKEYEQYRLYNDYTRANIVMTLSFNKSFNIFYETLRINESYTNQKKLSEGDIIYDYAQYNYIPILDYLIESVENDDLYESFTYYTNFLASFNFVTYGEREKILVKQETTNHYYTEENGIYTYYVSKKVITKEQMNKMYYEYLESVNEEDVVFHLATLLYEETNILKNYSYKKLVEELKNNYNSFFYEYEDTIVKCLAKDLENFTQFLFDNYILSAYNKNIDHYVSTALLKNIDSETLELTYSFTKLDRIYLSASKYYTYSYNLNLENILEQLETKGYPILYM